jgi:hypothetical protein
MGDILKHITELLETGNNFEIRREKYRPLTSNFFDAMDGEDEQIAGRTTTAGNKGAGIQVETTVEDKQGEG